MLAVVKPQYASRCSSGVEQRFCKPLAGGSNPFTGSHPPSTSAGAQFSPICSFTIIHCRRKSLALLYVATPFLRSLKELPLPTRIFG